MADVRTKALAGAAVGVSLAMLLVAGSHGRAQEAPRGALAGAVTVVSGGHPIADRSRVVVYLVGNGVSHSARVTKSIRQRERRFQPDFLVVPVGSTVEFPNDDHIFHNVFSLSRTKRFDLGLYRSGTSRSITLEREGVVDVYCNIHPEMVAKILVIDSMHYAVTDRDGAFRIRDVPSGSYEVVGWQAYGQPYRARVTIRSGTTTRLDFQLAAGRAPTRRHLRIDGTPYGRYR